MSEVFCPRCKQPLKGAIGICRECADELNVLAAKRRKRMSFIFTILVVIILYMLYKQGMYIPKEDAASALKNLTSLNLSS